MLCRWGKWSCAFYMNCLDMSTGSDLLWSDVLIATVPNITSRARCDFFQFIYSGLFIQLFVYPEVEPGYNHSFVALYWSGISEQINTIIKKNPLSVAYLQYLPYYKVNDPSRFNVLALNQKMCHLLPFYTDFLATPLTSFSHTWNLSSCHPQETEGAAIFCQLFFTPTPPAGRWMIDNSRLYIITKGETHQKGNQLRQLSPNCGQFGIS